MAMKKPDEGTIGTSSGPVLDRAGIKDTGYIDKKGTPNMQRVSSAGIEGHIFNQLPPGTDINNQAVSDVARTDGMTVRRVVDGSFPGDGWSGD